MSAKSQGGPPRRGAGARARPAAADSGDASSMPAAPPKQSKRLKKSADAAAPPAPAPAFEDAQWNQELSALADEDTLAKAGFIVKEDPDDERCPFVAHHQHQRGGLTMKLPCETREEAVNLLRALVLSKNPHIIDASYKQLERYEAYARHLRDSNDPLGSSDLRTTQGHRTSDMPYMQKNSDDCYTVSHRQLIEESPSKGRDAKVPPRERLNREEAKAKSASLVLKSNFWSRHLEQLRTASAADQANVRTAAQAVLVDKSNEEAIKARGDKDSVSEKKLAAAVASLCSDIGLEEPLDDYATLESKGIDVGRLVAIGSDDFFLAGEVQQVLADRRSTNRTACVNGDKDAINKMLKPHKLQIAKGLYPRLSTSVQVAIAERLELCGTQIFNMTST